MDFDSYKCFLRVFQHNLENFQDYIFTPPTTDGGPSTSGIAIIFGATILKVGYFLTTSLFLFTSYYFLCERRWILMFLLSFPFVAAFMYLLHGVLDIYLRDPFLKSIGVMG